MVVQSVLTADSATGPTDPPALAAVALAAPPSRPPVALLCVSVTALGIALQVNFGQYHPLALPWLAAALGGVGLCAPKRARGLAGREGPVVAACVAVQFALLVARSPLATAAGDAASLLPF